MKDDKQFQSIREQLNNLNNATDDINLIEAKLDVLRRDFRETRELWTKENSGMSKKQLRNITKSRLYYELKSKEEQARVEAQKAAKYFEQRYSIVEMTKETLNVLQKSLSSEVDPDLEKQYIDVIQQQLKLVAEAEEECTIAENIHAQRVKDLLKIEENLRKAAKDNEQSIKKSKLYYERQNLLKKQLELIMSLEDKVRNQKENYSLSMRMLEKISEEIHMERSQLLSNSSQFASCSIAESEEDDEDKENVFL
ncbi:unnamed protein product [Caenorhabditis bovis]|uniref:Guanine nucleotide exchange factor rei n=1 Tax=Caenorhabditis bovis TaxID=2654633 RepID=A0A8S1EPF3_9PELO|nr:unnamed protein product [Caenorhabditis bovis]